MKNGYFVISLDFELLWGLAGWTVEEIRRYQPRAEGAVAALRRIVELLSRYGMKCSVAHVGAMDYHSVEELQSTSSGVRPHYANGMFSSYESLLPTIGVEFPPRLFFCPDVLEWLRGCDNVELCSHTFSHYYCLEAGQSAEEFEADVRRATEEARGKGKPLRTIIFPRNQVSPEYLDICARYGLTHYRGNFENFLYRSETTPSRFDVRRVFRLLDTYVNLSGSNTYSPDKSRGEALRNVPGSRFLRPYTPALSWLEPLKVRRILKSMDHAARQGEVYHLWWHPHNFGLHAEESMRQLDRICRHFLSLRQRYQMESAFIGEL